MEEAAGAETGTAAPAISYVFAGMPVAQLGPALAWYERLLGRKPDMHPNENEAVWRLAETGSLYVVADAAHAGNALLTLIVDQLDDVVAALQARGILPASTEAAPGLYRKAVIVDPEGNTITFAELPSGGA